MVAPGCGSLAAGACLRLPPPEIGAQLLGQARAAGFGGAYRFGRIALPAGHGQAYT
jgi:hypothetical protein